MKTLLLFILFAAGNSFAQTNVIAMKSHSSSMVKDQHETDNFGDPMPLRTIQTVKYLNDDCLVEIYKSLWSVQEQEFDTICGHPFLSSGQTDIERIKEMYPEKTEFIGFDQLEKDAKAEKKGLRKEKRKKNKSSIFFYFLISGGTLFFLYLFVPSKRLVQP